MEEYLLDIGIQKVSCVVQKNNAPSLQLFKNCGYQSLNLDEETSDSLNLEKCLKR